MSRPSPAVVAAVAPLSLGEAHGIALGDRVVSVNGREPRDYIEYRYLIAEPRVRLVVETTTPEGRSKLLPNGGRRRTVTIEKSVDEDIGLQFTEDVFDGVITCRNRCAFCFVSQLPRGLRPALYVRDDDYRLSFLHGNFITLTNLTAADRARIVRDHLSPLYVSVHAIDPKVRRQVFGRETPDAVAEMRRLGAKGIRFHVQIVVCPGINDGEHLERTVRELAALHPVVQSIGVVPVGLTRHREGREKLRRVTPAMARRIAESVGGWQSELRRRLGRRVVFAADELYLSGDLALPRRVEYEGFPQLGNGIGCARQFLDSVAGLRPLRVASPVSVALVTGEMARPLVEQLGAKLASKMVRIQVCEVRNRLFGPSVTVAGLLAGADIARALRGCRRSDLAIVPGTAVREGEGFIDGMSVEQLANAVGATVVAASTPAEAAAAVRSAGRAGDTLLPHGRTTGGRSFRSCPTHDGGRGKARPTRGRGRR